MGMESVAGAIGSLVGAGASLWGAHKDRQMQKEFAQKGIQWKVADAEKAGIHPLYALGASTTSFAPVGVGDAGKHFADMGQDVSRAMAATSTEATKASAFNSAVQSLTLRKMSLENDLLASKIATINQAGTPPSPPSIGQRYNFDGQGSVPGADGNPLGLVQTSMMSRQAASPEYRWQEPAAITDVGFSKTVNGGYAPVMSNDVKQRLEEDWPGMLWWNARNRLLPAFGYGKSEPFPPDPGYAWVFNPVTGEYTQRKIAPGGLFTW